MNNVDIYTSKSDGCAVLRIPTSHVVVNREGKREKQTLEEEITEVDIFLRKMITIR